MDNLTLNVPRIKWLLASLVALLVLLVLFASPYLTLHQMRQAARAHDAQALAAYVDWPSLHESVQVGVQARLAQKNGDEKSRPTRASLWGASVAGALLKPMVEQLITPQSLMRLMQGQSPESAALRLPRKAKPSQDSATELEWRSHFEGLKHFVFSVRKSGTDEKPIELVLSREGILSWKLTALRLP